MSLLRQDPDRYALALFHALRNGPEVKQKKVSNREIALFVAWLVEGCNVAARSEQELRTQMNTGFIWAAFANNRRGTGQEHARASRLRKKLPTDAESLAWLATIGTAWMMAFYGSPSLQQVWSAFDVSTPLPVEMAALPPGHLRDCTIAAALCAVAGEREWFERVLTPIINYRHGLGGHPQLTSSIFSG